MKGFLWFIAGFIVGVGCIVLLGLGASASDDGRTFFDEPGDCIVSSGSLEVFQASAGAGALVKRKNASYDDLIMLLHADDNVAFYDDQIIKIPAGKCARQIGVYEYTNRADMVVTVPIVKIME